MEGGGRALPSQDIFDEAMAFLDACEPEHLRIINMRSRQLQASGHGATERGRVVMNTSQHPGHHLALDPRHSLSEGVAGLARSQAQYSLDRSLRSTSHNVQVPQTLPAPGVSLFGIVTPPANLSNVSLQLETRGQFQCQSPQALIGSSMHVYQHSGTLQPRLHGETNVQHQQAHGTMSQVVQQEPNDDSSPLQGQPPFATPWLLPGTAVAGASAGQINQPHVPAAAGGIAGGGAPRAPRKRATLDAETVLQIFFTRTNPSSCLAWATEQGVTPKAVRDIWNLRTWRQ